MASTNKTTNYELSQYIGTDKPTYLGDYNGDMSKIDANLKLVSDKANSGDTKGTQALTNAQTAQTKADNAYDLADEANQTATLATNTASQALDKALLNETALNKFKLTSHNSAYRSPSDSNTPQITLGKWNSETHTFTQTNSGLTSCYCNIKVDTNETGEVGKLYGAFNVTCNYTINATTYPCLRLRCSDMNIKVPEEGYAIWSAGVAHCSNNQAGASIYVKEDGYIYIYGNLNITASNAAHKINLFPCLYFFEDFGNEGD